MVLHRGSDHSRLAELMSLVPLPKRGRPTIEQIQDRQKLHFATILVGCEYEPHSRSALIRHIEQKWDQLCGQAAPLVKHADIASTHAMPPCSQ